MRTRGELDQSSVGGHDLLRCIEARGSLAVESLLWALLSIMPTMMSSLEVVHYFTLGVPTFSKTLPDLAG